MAMEPGAISARPPTTISRVFCTAPESPAARAKGTVSPSAMPITTSRTKFVAMKWVSTCSACAMFNLGMRFQIFLRALHHVPLAPISQLAGSFVEQNPGCALDLYSHFGSDVVNLARNVAEQ